MEPVSIALGQRRIRTTQAYYCQKSLDTVNSEVLRALDDALLGCLVQEPFDFSDR